MPTHAAGGAGLHGHAGAARGRRDARRRGRQRRARARVRERTEALGAGQRRQWSLHRRGQPDLRQPVASIGLLAGLLREPMGEARQRSLIESASSRPRPRFESLLKGLLDLSRLDAGTVQRAGPRCRCSHCSTPSRRTAAGAVQRGIHLRFRPTGCVVVGCALLLEQMLRNLVGNAVRYTARAAACWWRRGGAASECCCRCGTRRRHGRGQQAWAFDDFVQFEPAGAEGAVRGLGLGLAIVQHRLSRPCAHAALAAGARQLLRTSNCRWSGGACCVDAPAPVTGRPLAGRCVLVVDDEPCARRCSGARKPGCAGARPPDERAHRRPGQRAADTADLLITDLRLRPTAMASRWCRARRPCARRCPRWWSPQHAAGRAGAPGRQRRRGEQALPRRGVAGGAAGAGAVRVPDH